MCTRYIYLFIWFKIGEHAQNVQKKNVTTNRHIEETGKRLDVSIDYDSDCSVSPTPLISMIL